MNFFEAEIRKYDRRIQRISQDPDPAKLKCNLLLNQMWLDYRKQLLKEWEQGMPFVYDSGGGLPIYLFRAMGFRPIHLPMTADRATREAGKYFEVSRGLGYPDSTCDRIQVEMGLVLSGDLPKPSFVAICSGECLPITYGAYWLAERFGCPAHALDCDLEDSLDSVRYLASQCEEMIRLAEKSVPGVKYDEARHIEYQRKVMQAQAYEWEIYELKKQVPCPISGKDALRMPGRELIDDPRYLEYFQLFRDEVKERAEKGIGALPEEKMRVMWLVSAPFYADPFSFLESRGVAIPIYDVGVGSGRENRSIDDEATYGRKLTPLEFDASVMNRGWRRGMSERKVQFVLARCRDLHIDAIVYFMLWGCMPELGMARIVADRVEQELGIPTLMIEGACLDSQRYNQADFEARLDAFVSMCLARIGASAAQ
ncbi:MAG: 2-hydroxyacyl-CoA dehydratase [Chloroflexi bacterium]|nr:2-hydroxyacyl-CoA dehydratase [Chloroflexota bacterium]